MGRISKTVERRNSHAKKKIIPTRSCTEIDNNAENYEFDYEDDVFYAQEPRNCRRSGKSFERALSSLSSRSNKNKICKKSRGTCEKSDKISGALRSALSFMPGMKHKLTDNLNQILDTVHDAIPLAVNLVLPLAFRSVLPGGMHRMASDMVAEKVVPVLQDQVYPAVVSRLIPEDIRYEVARKRSLRSSRNPEDEEFEEVYL
jgi:hypothetical protein